MNSKFTLPFLALFSVNALAAEENSGFVPLFAEDGVPKGWLVRRWDDVSKPAEKASVWRVESGLLRGSEPRGTWLLSEKEYGDFVLEFEFKLGRLSDADFRRLEAGYKAEAALILQKLDQLGVEKNLDELIERDVAARRSRLSSSAPASQRISPVGETIWLLPMNRRPRSTPTRFAATMYTRFSHARARVRKSLT